MAGLIRWRPQQELMPRRFFGRDWEDFFEGFMEPWRGEEWRPRVESFQKDGNFVIKADLPGVSPKDIDISVEGSHLSIHGDRKTDKETKKKGFHRREMFYGSFERSIPIPSGLDVKKVKAKYHDGVLEITAPYEKAKLPKPIRVEVEKTA